MTHHEKSGDENRGHEAEPIFKSIRENLFSSVIGDVLDSLGHYHQILPAYLTPMKPEMKLVGRAMPVQLADVFGVQAEPFGKLTLALDQLDHGLRHIGQVGPLVAHAARGRALPAAGRGAQRAGRKEYDEEGRRRKCQRRGTEGQACRQ